MPVAGLAQSGSEWGSTPIWESILLTVSVRAVAKVTFVGLGWLVKFVVRLLDKLVNDFQLCWLPRWTGEIPSEDDAVVFPEKCRPPSSSFG